MGFSPDRQANEVDKMAAAILSKIDAVQQQSSKILLDYDGSCECPPDHIAFPHHRHSIWKTDPTTAFSGDLSCKVAVADLPNIWEPDPDSRPYVKGMPSDDLAAYGLLYCGGRNKLLDTLVEVSKDLKVPFHEEAFDW
jgi:hypothetical protein